MTIYYLGGPIRRHGSFEQYDKRWRDIFIKTVQDRGLDVAFENPMEFFSQRNDPMVIGMRDRMLMDRCNAGLFNLFPFTKDKYPCIGALWEMGYMAAQGKPVFVMAAPDSPFRTHPMTCYSGFFNSLQDALDELF